jgi:hypothetical protein
MQRCLQVPWLCIACAPHSAWRVCAMLLLPNLSRQNLSLCLSVSLSLSHARTRAQTQGLQNAMRKADASGVMDSSMMFRRELESVISNLCAAATSMQRVSDMVMMPLAYVSHTRAFLLIWLACLPYVLIYYLQGWTILVCTTIGYALLGMEDMVLEIECPYGTVGTCVCGVARAVVRVDGRLLNSTQLKPPPGHVRLPDGLDDGGCTRGAADGRGPGGRNGAGARRSFLTWDVGGAVRQPVMSAAMPQMPQDPAAV